MPFVNPTVDAGCIDAPVPAEHAPGRARRAAGRVLTVVFLIPVIGLVAVLALALAGLRPAIEQSDSMAPSIVAGDLIFTQSIAPTEAKVGDVITFSDPRAGEDATLTHRVRSVHSAANGELAFVTRGDANTGTERWKVPATGSVGRFAFAVPKLGFLAQSVQRQIFGIVILLAGAALSFDLLRRFWRPAPERDAGAGNSE